MAAQLFFDSVADLYESVRPGYSDLLIDDLLRYADTPISADILDIGCGTGKSTEPFIQRHFNITAMDPGENMLNICRRKFSSYSNINYALSDFESYDPNANRFDLIVSGTAFHWVSAESHHKLHDLLKPNGSVGIFWHTYMATEDELAKALDSVYKEYAPQLYSEDIVAIHELDDLRKEKSIISWPGFQEWRIIRYYKDHVYSTSRYIDLLKTYSTHTTLGHAFYSAMENTINSSGGSITIPVRTTLCFGKRNNADFCALR